MSILFYPKVYCFLLILKEVNIFHGSLRALGHWTHPAEGEVTRGKRERSPHVLRGVPTEPLTSGNKCTNGILILILVFYADSVT